MGQAQTVTNYGQDSKTFVCVHTLLLIITKMTLVLKRSLLMDNDYNRKSLKKHTHTYTDIYPLLKCPFFIKQYSSVSLIDEENVLKILHMTYSSYSTLLGLMGGGGGVVGGGFEGGFGG
jgi:hypothetical protein